MTRDLAYSLEIEGLVSHKHKLEAEVARLQSENQKLWEALNSLAALDGYFKIVCAKIEAIKDTHAALEHKP
jgi:hypothetical protein